MRRLGPCDSSGGSRSHRHSPIPDGYPRSANCGHVRSGYPYQDLTRADFDQIVQMLSEGIASTRGRYGAYLHHDSVNGILRARRGSRLAAITSGGAIPEKSLYTVIAQPEGAIV